jgi:hypothetical protein
MGSIRDNATLSKILGCRAAAHSITAPPKLCPRPIVSCPCSLHDSTSDANLSIWGADNSDEHGFRTDSFGQAAMQLYEAVSKRPAITIGPHSICPLMSS